MRKKTLELFAFTPEGRIVRVLSSGAKSFSKLVKVTGLSERWLSVKLKWLLKLGVVQLIDKRYRVDVDRLHDVLVPSLREIGWMAAYEIVGKHPQVLGVLLYGSVAKGKAEEESDVDFLAVSEDSLDLFDDEYELSMKYGVAFEITSVDLKEFLAMLHLKSALLFGILEGYDVLFDRAGIATMLAVLKKDICKNWRYDEGEELWVKLEK